MTSKIDFAIKEFYYISVAIIVFFRIVYRKYEINYLFLESYNLEYNVNVMIVSSSYKTFYEHLNLPILICDNNGKLLYVNESGRKYFKDLLNDLYNCYTNCSIIDLFDLTPLQIKQIQKVLDLKNHEQTIVLERCTLQINRLNKKHIIIQIIFPMQLHSIDMNKYYETPFHDHYGYHFFYAYDFLDDLVHITDKNGKIIYANKAIQKLFGNIVGNYCYQVFNGYDSPCPDCKLPYVLNGSTVRYEIQLLKNQQHYDVINSPFYGMDGQIFKISIMRNIEDLIEKQNELSLYQNAINKSRNLVCFIDENGHILYANDTFKTYFSISSVKEQKLSKLLNMKNEDLLLLSNTNESKIVNIYNNVYLKLFVYSLKTKTDKKIYVVIASDISDLKLLENKLALEKNYFKSIIDNTIDGFFVVDANFQLIDYNQSFLQMFNLLNRDVHNIKLTEIFDDLHLKDFERKIKYMDKSRTPQIIEVSQHSDSTKHYIISINYLQSSKKEDPYYYGFVKDITDIVKLRKIIENERNYNRRIIETVQLGFVVINEFDEIIDYNNAFLLLTGQEGKNIKGHKFNTYIKLDSSTHTAPHSHQLSNYEALLFTIDHRIKNVIISMSPLYDVLGNYLGKFAFIHDITHQKQIEQEIIQQSQQIIHLINLLTEFTANVVKIDDKEQLLLQIYTFINSFLQPDYCEILVNTNSQFVRFTYKNDEQRFQTIELHINNNASSLLQKLKHQRSIIVITNPKVELNDYDHIHFNFILQYQTILLIPIIGGNKLQTIVICAFNKTWEITNVINSILTGVANLISISIEKINYIGEQNKMKEALDRYEKLIAIGRIIAGVAHEINNPLSIMQLDLAELDQRLSSIGHDESIKEILHSLLEEIQRISNIVRQLKDYAKPATLSDDIINLNEIFKNYPLKILTKNIQKKGIQIHINTSRQKVLVKMPLTRLIQVLMNILTNAEDAILEKGTGSITIDISTEDRNNQQYARLSIKDTGIGIAEEHMQLIFEPFFTTKQKEGTGLGLSISYSIIKNYNGEIEVNSKIGQGTEIIILLPLYQPH